MSIETTNNYKPVVFFDVSIDGNQPQRLLFQLFSDVAPNTAENFRALCTGEKGFSRNTGKPLHYKGTFFHRIVKGNLAQGGDFLRHDGNYGESIYEGKFPDEYARLKHDGPGLLSMYIADRDERGSLFSVTFKANRRLDRKCVVCGKILDGFEVLRTIENAGDEDGKPAVSVKIINSGELTDDRDKANKLKTKMCTNDEHYHESNPKQNPKRSSKKHMKRRQYYTSESDTSTDSATESSESDTSLSDTSSSSDDRQKKRKKRSKKYRHRRGKKKDRRRDKQLKKRDRNSKHKSKRVGVSDSESSSSSDSEDDVSSGELNREPKKFVEQGTSIVNHKAETADMSGSEEGKISKETGAHQGNDNGKEFKSDESPRTCPDVTNHPPCKSRSLKIPMSKCMSISPRNGGRSPGTAPNYNTSKKPSVSRSPRPISVRSRSISAARSGNSPNPVISPRRSREARNISKSPIISPPRRRVTRSPQRISSRTFSLRSPSRSPVIPSRNGASRSPIRCSHRSGSRSSGRASTKSPIPNPVRDPSRTNRHSYSRSPLIAGHRSSSRSPVDGTPKKVRHRRGSKDKNSNGRLYRNSSRGRSPTRPYRYGGRNECDRYSSYRRSPRRYRISPHGRTPRYRQRRSRSRSRSVSRSPIRYRHRRYNRSPVPRAFERPKSASLSRNRSRSVSAPPRDSRSPKNIVKDKSRRSLSGSPPRKAALVSCGNRSHLVSAPSHDSGSPKNIVKYKSRRSPSGSPHRKATLVSYDNGSPDSGRD